MINEDVRYIEKLISAFDSKAMTKVLGVLKENEKATFNEIAEKTGLKKGHVAVLLHRAAKLNLVKKTGTKRKTYYINSKLVNAFKENISKIKNYDTTQCK